jgi:hypothetical protein
MIWKRLFMFIYSFSLHFIACLSEYKIISFLSHLLFIFCYVWKRKQANKKKIQKDICFEIYQLHSFRHTFQPKFIWEMQITQVMICWIKKKTALNFKWNDKETTKEHSNMQVYLKSSSKHTRAEGHCKMPKWGRGTRPSRSRRGGRW